MSFAASTQRFIFKLDGIATHHNSHIENNVATIGVRARKRVFLLKWFQFFRIAPLMSCMDSQRRLFLEWTTHHRTLVKTYFSHFCFLHSFSFDVPIFAIDVCQLKAHYFQDLPNRLCVCVCLENKQVFFIYVFFDRLASSVAIRCDAMQCFESICVCFAKSKQSEQFVPVCVPINTYPFLFLSNRHRESYHCVAKARIRVPQFKQNKNRLKKRLKTETSK